MVRRKLTRNRHKIVRRVSQPCSCAAIVLRLSEQNCKAVRGLAWHRKGWLVHVAGHHTSLRQVTRTARSLLLPPSFHGPKKAVCNGHHIVYCTAYLWHRNVESILPLFVDLSAERTLYCLPSHHKPDSVNIYREPRKTRPFEAPEWVLSIASSRQQQPKAKDAQNARKRA